MVVVMFVAMFTWPVIVFLGHVWMVRRRRHKVSVALSARPGTCIEAGCPVDYPDTPRRGGTERGSKT